MKRTIALLSVFTLLILSSVFSASHAARNEIALPGPDMTGGIPLMQALSKRQTSRSFSDKALSDQVLSNLLWAANGINRPASGMRTAPSAMNKQEIDIYVAMAEGMYLYNAPRHALTLVVAKDIRALAGVQPFVKNAPVNLVYVADMTKAAGFKPEDKRFMAAADAGFIGQNVYLFCASEGLATVIRASMNRDALIKELKLDQSRMILLAQTVGYPKEKK